MVRGKQKVDKEVKLVYQLFPMDWRLVFRLVAVLVSWYFNHSIGWALIHYCFGWFYLMYIMITGGFAEGQLHEIINYYFF